MEVTHTRRLHPAVAARAIDRFVEHATVAETQWLHQDAIVSLRTVTEHLRGQAEKIADAEKAGKAVAATGDTVEKANAGGATDMPKEQEASRKRKPDSGAEDVKDKESKRSKRSK